MKITIPNFTQSPVAFMRACGYAFNRETGPVKPAGHGAGVESSCMRRLSGHDYPRYHAYVHTEETTNNYSPRFRGEAGKLIRQPADKNLVINLHIDQKKPSYEGSNAHSGEYDGELVEREMERIRKFTEA